MANKRYAVTAGGLKIGWTAKDGVYDTALLTELGVDDVTADPTGVLMRAKPVDFGVPRVVLGIVDAAGKRKSATLYFSPTKYDSVIGIKSTLVGKTYKGGKIVSANRPSTVSRS